MRDYKKGSEWKRWDLHLHTASSYDHQYKASDSDTILCESLTSNGVVAVAITDHFIIDKERIQSLKTIAPEIVFFPGVELRTDKGDSNIHVILIFDDTINLQELSEDFNVFKRTKAKNPDNDDKVYWDYRDIVEFAKTHNALISIHAGKKTSGIDDRISNSLEISQAIKEEYAESVNFFEMGKIKDIDEYNKFVFKEIEAKPMIICSDNHDPRHYIVKHKLWMKSNPTFEGLLQCLYHPKERVYVGEMPPLLERETRDKRSNIESISVKQIENPKNDIVKWFDFNITLNSGLVAIIGNKGSGKSALSDIIGHLCKSSNMGHASFLSQNRFRKSPKNYSNDYISSITWKDGHEENMPLSKENYDTVIENAQYLPQKYIEEVCNDIDNKFQAEIDKVIFSYVDDTERGDAKNLKELIDNKSGVISLKLENEITNLKQSNKKIIKLEEKKTASYKKVILDSTLKLKEDLNRHKKSKPEEIEKPALQEENQEYSKNLDSLNSLIGGCQTEIDANIEMSKHTNNKIMETELLIAKIKQFKIGTVELNEEIDVFIIENKLVNIDTIVISTPLDILATYLEKLECEKVDLIKQLKGNSIDPVCLYSKIKDLKEQKEALILTASETNKVYQNYIKEVESWNKIKIEIEGNETTDNTIKYFEKEMEYISEKLDEEYRVSIADREQIFTTIFNTKEKLVDIYKNIYVPVELEIQKLLGNIEEAILFDTEIQLVDSKIGTKLLDKINQRYVGIFGGKVESQNQMEKFVRNTEFNNMDSILNFINNILKVVNEDIDKSSKKVSDKQSFYDELFGLCYIDVAYKLKLGTSDLAELSPGERGIVLLVFYLALSKNSIPIIIDQPEDNLDNQSVFHKLVPCICEAKKKRQVIIVTHNPNIAVACDAEQIVFCSMSKSTHEIKYITGAIEDIDMRKHVIDVLEGTMPAFDLRKRKYINSN